MDSQNISLSSRNEVKWDSSNNNMKKKKRHERKKQIIQNWQLYIFILPAFLYFFIFHYIPMYGVQIAFKDFVPSLGIWGSDWVVLKAYPITSPDTEGSDWVGFEHFKRFFDSYYFWDLIKNTLGISIYELIVGFPLPIILALALNEAKDGFYKKTVQTVTYAPHFISVVVISG